MAKFDNKVDQFVYNSMLNYPSIFPNRAAVLTHALMIIGNGIEWHVGQLHAKAEHESSTKALEALERELETLKLDTIRKLAADEEERDSPDAEFVERMTARYVKLYDGQLEEQSAVIRAASRRAGKKIEPGSCKGGHYEQQFGGYGNMFNLPFNVDSEWLEACYEMAEYVKNVNIYYKQIVDYLDLIKEMRILYRDRKPVKSVYEKRMKAIQAECKQVFADHKAQKEKENAE